MIGFAMEIRGRKQDPSTHYLSIFTDEQLLRMVSESGSILKLFTRCHMTVQYLDLEITLLTQ